MQKVPVAKALALLLAAGVLMGCENEYGFDPTARVTVMRAQEVPEPEPTDVNGRLKATVGAPVQNVVTAAILALNDYHLLNVSGGTVGGEEGLVTATTPRGEKIIVDIKLLSEEVSRFGIRSDTTGIEALTTAIFGHIVDILNSNVAATTLTTPQEVSSQFTPRLRPPPRSPTNDLPLPAVVPPPAP